MTHVSIARDLLMILCGVQGIATVAIDFSHAHATNPEWPGHARYHVVWQATSTGLLSLIEFALLLLRGPLQDERFYLASILAAIPMLGFFGALIGRRLYGGALSDPNGIRPLSFAAFGSKFKIDLNLAAEVAAMFLLLAIVALFKS